MEQKFDTIMGKLDESDKQYLSHFLNITNDKFSRNILAQMATQKSSLSYKNIRLMDFGDHNIAHAMGVLRSMEKIGLISSAMVKGKLDHYRSYDITDEGRSFVDRHMPRELAYFSTA